MPKLRIEEAAARRQARDRPRRGGRSSASTSTSSARGRRRRHPRHRQHRGARAADRAPRPESARARDAGACEAALDALTQAARERRGQPARAVDRGGARARHGRRDLRRAGEGVRPPPRARSAAITGVYGGAYAGRRGLRDAIQREVDGVRRERGPPAADAGRQAGPGRPRPRRQGDRDRLRRPRLRRRHRPAVPDARGGARARRSRTTSTWSASRALAAGHKTLVPAAHRGAEARRAPTTSWSSCGGVIPPQDYEFLQAPASAAIYRPRHQHPGPRQRLSRLGRRSPAAACACLDSVRPLQRRTASLRKRVRIWPRRAGGAALARCEPARAGGATAFVSMSHASAAAMHEPPRADVIAESHVFFFFFFFFFRL